MTTSMFTEPVLRLHHAGHSPAQIAAQLGISVRTVFRIKAAHGLNREQKPPWSPEEIAAAAALLDDGASQTEAARSIGRSQRTIRKHFPGRGWTKEQHADYMRALHLRKAVGA